MTQEPVRLIPMACVRCQAALPAKVDEVAWACAQCGQGLLLDDEKGLTGMDVFYANAIVPGKTGRPFWVSRGQVTITGRETYSGDEGRAARAFWSAPRLFYIPAYDTSLEDVVKTGVSLLRDPVRIEAGSPAPFLPVVTPPGDLRALAEFMILSIEAERRDALKKVTFDLQFDPPQLWILP